MAFRRGSPSFEKAYREYISARLEYYDFKHSLRELTRLGSELGSASFTSLEDGDTKTKKLVFDESRLARLEHVTHKESLEAGDDEDTDALLESIRTIYSEGSPEYERAYAELLAHADTKFETKKQVEERIAELRAKVQELWEDPMVRYFSGKEEVETILREFAEGKDVLHHAEYYYQREQAPRLGAAALPHHGWRHLGWPPGVGKTSMVRDYLEAKGRKSVYIDLSEDVTRYLLYGSKSLEFKDPAQRYEQLVSQLQKLDPKSFRAFVAENSKGLKEVFATQDGEAAILYISQLEEALAGLAKTSPMR